MPHAQIRILQRCRQRVSRFRAVQPRQHLYSEEALRNLSATGGIFRDAQRFGRLLACQTLHRESLSHWITGNSRLAQRSNIALLREALDDLIYIRSGRRDCL
jgi:hypothetical protein